MGIILSSFIEIYIMQMCVNKHKEVKRYFRQILSLSLSLSGIVTLNILKQVC